MLLLHPFSPLVTLACWVSGSVARLTPAQGQLWGLGEVAGKCTIME